MKNSTGHFKFITVLFFVSLCVYACKKDATVQSGLVGTWIYSHAYDKGEVYNQSYQFKSDSTVQITRTITDSASGKLLGYQYLSNGKFRLNADQLKLYKLSSFNYTGGSPYYTTIDKLPPYTTDTLQAHTINVSADNKSFFFVTPPCPPNANCTGILIFKRHKNNAAKK
jgi:hypothetical protein